MEGKQEEHNIVQQDNLNSEYNAKIPEEPICLYNSEPIQDNQLDEFITLPIDIAPGETEELTIHKDSQPEKIAYDFCLKHSLNFDCLQPLSDHIKTSLSINNRAIAINPNSKEIQLEDLPESPLVSPNVNINNNSKPVLQKDLCSKRMTTMTSSNKKRGTDYEYVPTASSANSRLFLYESIINKPPINSSLVNKMTKGKNCKTTKGNYKRNNLKSNNNAYLSPTVNSALKREIAPVNTTSNDEILQKLITNTMNYNETNQPFTTTTNQNPEQNPFKTLNRHLPNYGERLYHKGRKCQEITKEKVNRIKNDIITNTKKNATFKPKINDISYNALSKRYYNKKMYDNEDMIINYKEYSNTKIENLRKKHEPTDTYSFTPTLNKKSLMIEESKHSKEHLPNRFECLYDNYKKQQMTIERLTNQIYDKNILFKPEINEYYNSSITTLSFDERKEYFKSKLIEKNKQTKEQIESMIDHITGRPYFQPEINAFEYERPKEWNIYNSLYKDHAKIQLKKEEREKLNAIYIMNTAQNYTNINKESHDMYEKRKEKIFRNLFQILDSDQDGMITKRNIDSKGLPKNIEKILLPIIEELKEENETLTENEFTTACFHLFQMINYTEKNDLLMFDNKMTIENKKNNNLSREEKNKLREKNALLFHLRNNMLEENDEDEEEVQSQVKNDYLTEETEQHEIHDQNDPIIENEINSTDQ